MIIYKEKLTRPTVTEKMGWSYAYATTTYSYSGAYYKYAERDFRGFGKVIQTNPDGTTITTNYEQLDDYKKGRPLQVDMKNPSGALLKRSTFTWGADTLTGTIAKFVKLTNKKTDTYGATNVFTNEAFTYNNTHGGVLQTIKSGTGAGENADVVVISNTYINANASSWVWRKASETVASPFYGLARQSTYTYNSLGNLLTSKRLSNPSFQRFYYWIML